MRAVVYNPQVEGYYASNSMWIPDISQAKDFLTVGAAGEFCRQHQPEGVKVFLYSPGRSPFEASVTPGKKVERQPIDPLGR